MAHFLPAIAIGTVQILLSITVSRRSPDRSVARSGYKSLLLALARSPVELYEVMVKKQDLQKV